MEWLFCCSSRFVNVFQKLRDAGKCFAVVGGGGGKVGSPPTKKATSGEGGGQQAVGAVLQQSWTPGDRPLQRTKAARQGR